ncbi:MAG: formylglycine-generating enzyme family protein, partial [Kiritimatiellae bacterium]|nr:formylglycine-generating enzyme family protein [Kiritimatiellia bacterium]
LDIPPASLTGDIYGVSNGLRRIVWDPMKTAYTNNHVLTQFNVTLTPTPVPIYMIVDLRLDKGDSGQIEYVYEEDLTNDVWGAWVRNPITNNGAVIESVIWTGATTNDLYKTDKLVLRRIPSGKGTIGGFGYTANEVIFTKECYAGIFQVTAAQWAHIIGGSASVAAAPKNMVSYNDIRGATNSVPGINWPLTGHEVSPDSFLYELRAVTGLHDFDLPTEAQWEYLCRAGTTTLFNDGNADAYYDGAIEENNGYTNKYLDVLGWYLFNSNNEVHPVGQKKANAWGLYDMHGNVWEWCLDWYAGTVASGIDPVGPEVGSNGNRLARGGSYSHRAAQTRSSYRLSSAAPTYSSGINYGFRLVLNLP